MLNRIENCAIDLWTCMKVTIDNRGSGYTYLVVASCIPLVHGRCDNSQNSAGRCSSRTAEDMDALCVHWFSPIWYFNNASCISLHRWVTAFHHWYDDNLLPRALSSGLRGGDRMVRWMGKRWHQSFYTTSSLCVWMPPEESSKTTDCISNTMEQCSSAIFNSTKTNAERANKC